MFDIKSTLHQLKHKPTTSLKNKICHYLYLSGKEFTVFAKDNNLLDEKVRDHTSLLKNFAPKPGMEFETGV